MGELWSLTSSREKMIKIGANVVSHARYVTFQMAENSAVRSRRNEAAHSGSPRRF
jgi:hypothetical protein